MKAFSRSLSAALTVILVLVSFVYCARSDEQQFHSGHAIAMYGKPKYSAGFKHFDYVNPAVPKGGEMRLGVPGTFDSFNPYVVKGNSAAGL